MHDPRGSFLYHPYVRFYPGFGLRFAKEAAKSDLDPVPDISLITEESWRLPGFPNIFPFRGPAADADAPPVPIVTGDDQPDSTRSRLAADGLENPPHKATIGRFGCGDNPTGGESDG